MKDGIASGIEKPIRVSYTGLASAWVDPVGKDERRSKELV